MPELAEVEYYRKQWDPGVGCRVLAADVHPGARVFRGADTAEMVSALRGKVLKASFSHGKNLLFQFAGGTWLGGHLGMTGKLFSISRESAGQAAPASLLRPGAPAADDPKHHHLVLRQRAQDLVFCDPRMFGKLTLFRGPEAPVWWRTLPPEILSPGFHRGLVAGVLSRRKKSPVKAVLLDQSVFPGVGNWMADEILWRCRTDPAAPAQSLAGGEVATLWRQTRQVARSALRVIGTDWSRPPDSWLFNHRWRDGGICPRRGCGAALVRESIGGRTTCWCPACQA